MTTPDRADIGVSARVLTLGTGSELVLLAALWVTVGLGVVGWLAGIGYALIGCAWLARGVCRAPDRELGPADLVTLSRAVLVGGVTALVAERAATDGQITALVVLATVALVLDGVDGYVARRTRTVSALGARFDMEVDAFLILVLSVYVAESLGAWVLAIGAMRYAFGVAGWLAPWLQGQLPPSLARKAVAAFQGIALVIAAPGVLPHPVAVTVVGVALASLLWSFGRDVAWLWRARCRDIVPLAVTPA